MIATGHLDLFVARYIQFDPREDPGAGGSEYCQLNGVPTLVVRGDSTVGQTCFTEIAGTELSRM